MFKRTWQRTARRYGFPAALLALTVLPGAGQDRAAEPPPATLPQPVALQFAQVPRLPQPQAQPPAAPPVEAAPAPNPLAPPELGEVPFVPPACGPGAPGAIPQASHALLKEMQQYIDRTIEPMTTLDLILGRSRLLVLKEAPKRIQGEGVIVLEGQRGGGAEGNIREGVATAFVVSPKEISLVGRRLGTGVLNLWFTDLKDPKKQRIISYLVRVLPDPALYQQYEARYKALADQINHAFPDSHVCLALVGNKLMVSGQARDVFEATQILNIVRSNAPRGRSGVPAAVAPPITLTTSSTDVGLTGTTTQTIQQPLANMQAAAGPNVINLLRIPGEQQVMLKVTVAEVNRAAARSIGVNFSISNRRGITVFANNTGNLATGTGGAVSSNGNTAAGGAASGISSGVGSLVNLSATLGGGDVALAVNALRNMDLARSLAEPNLTTVNGKRATFSSGGSFPIVSTTGATSLGLQSVTFQPFGIQVSFTPVITDGDRIRLDVDASVSTRDNSQGTTIGTGGVATGVPGLSSRSFHTVVELRDGETMAVAGLIQNNYGADATRVPFFGDLPVIGRLFAFDRASTGDQELVMLVTPVLVHPLGPKERAPLPGSDIFEPGDIEFYLLGRLESQRTQDYRSPVRTDLARMLRYNHCEDVYIIGPQGPSDGH